MPAIVAALKIYPVKGLQGQDLPAAEVERCGLEGDRRWLVVDADGRFLTQRQHPGMARLTAAATSGGLVLGAPGMAGLTVAAPGADAETLQVTVWRDTLAARLAGADAAGWLSAAIGVDCRLAWMADTDLRPADPRFAGPGCPVSFADGFPLLLTTTGSLDDLNQRLPAPVPMARFRPNLVVTGVAAWAEDRWRRIRVGEVVFRLCKPSSRCLVTTIDQSSGERPDPQEPLRTLGRFRRAEGGVMFGQNMVAERLGTVRVGDAVEVLEDGSPNVRPLHLETSR